MKFEKGGGRDVVEMWCGELATGYVYLGTWYSM